MSDNDRRYSYDRHHRHHHHHHRGYSRERDYSDRDDSYRREQRRVPGLVTDPSDSRYSTVDREIRRGQAESMERYKTDSYYGKDQGRSKITKDTMSPPAYNISSTQPYLPRSHKNDPPFYTQSSSKKRSRLPCNPSLLSFFSGFVGVAVILAAIIIVDWYSRVSVAGGTNINVATLGLFTACTKSGSTVSCGSIENFSSEAGNVFSDLEQASRALIIIAAIFGFVALGIDIFFALHSHERRRGAYYGGAAFLLAGCCGVAAMGCYSSVISSAFNATTIRSAVFPGVSFFLGWFGTTLFLLSALISFLSNATSWSK